MEKFNQHFLHSLVYLFILFMFALLLIYKVIWRVLAYVFHLLNRKYVAMYIRCFNEQQLWILDIISGTVEYIAALSVYLVKSRDDIKYQIVSKMK